MVSDPVAPVEGVGGVEAGYHLLYALWAIDRQRRGSACHPGTQVNVRKPRDVIGVKVGEEDPIKPP